MQSNNIKYTNKLFNSIDKKHQIEISILDDVGWFNINKLDCESCKTFLLLLKQVMEYLSLNNIKYIKQHIMYEDLDNFPNSSHVESANGNYYIVSIDIENFVLESVNALGINKL